MNKQALAAELFATLRDINITISITRKHSPVDHSCWQAKIIDGIEGTGNTQVQALESAVAQLKKAIKEREEEQKIDKELKDRIVKELFNTCDQGAAQYYMKSRSPSDLVTDVTALVKKLLHDNCIRINSNPDAENNDQYKAYIRQQAERLGIIER